MEPAAVTVTVLVPRRADGGRRDRLWEFCRKWWEAEHPGYELIEGMDVKAIAIAFAVALFYGGMVWGVLPIQPGISWESHLLGAIVGALLAFRHRKSHLSEQEPYIPDEEPTTPVR